MNLKSAPATILLGSLGLALVAALAWVGLIGPALDQRGATDESRVQIQDHNQAMRLELARLRKEADDLPATDTLAADLDAMFPATADQPGFFAAVSSITDRAGISPKNVTVLSPGVPEVLLPAGAAPATSPEAAAAAAASAPATTPAPPAPADLAVQEVTVGVNGSYTQLVDVLRGLEDMPRAFLVSKIDVTSDEEGVLSLSVVGSTFVASPLKPETS